MHPGSAWRTPEERRVGPQRPRSLADLPPAGVAASRFAVPGIRRGAPFLTSTPLDHTLEGEHVLGTGQGKTPRGVRGESGQATTGRDPPGRGRGAAWAEANGRVGVMILAFSFSQLPRRSELFERQESASRLAAERVARLLARPPHSYGGRDHPAEYAIPRAEPPSGGKVATTAYRLIARRWRS